MKETQLQIKLPGVPQAKQGREVPPQWEWTEAAVWTERMLATLERGITGGKWYSLDDKVWKMENLQRAVEKVAAGKSPKKTGRAQVPAICRTKRPKTAAVAANAQRRKIRTQTRATSLDTQSWAAKKCDP